MFMTIMMWKGPILIYSIAHPCISISFQYAVEAIQAVHICPWLSGKCTLPQRLTGKADLGLMSSECLMLRELLVSSREALLRGHRSQVRYGQMVDDTSRWP